jgi:hypothetical protein
MYFMTPAYRSRFERKNALSATVFPCVTQEKDMKTTVTKWATKAAGAGAVALLLATPSFAQSRGDWSRNNNSDRNKQTIDARNNGDRSNNNGYRENQRFNESGKVSSFNRERDGYRVQLDRGRSFWVPESRFGNRARELRPGLSITFGGVFRGGAFSVDAVSWPDQYNRGYANGFVRGVVERVDYRSGTLVVRDQATGRLITADVTRGTNNLRRGDVVGLTGQWIRSGVFDVARVDHLGGRRY